FIMFLQLEHKRLVDDNTSFLQVERSTLDQVQKRLDRLKKKQKEEKPQEDEFEARLQTMRVRRILNNKSLSGKRFPPTTIRYGNFKTFKDLYNNSLFADFYLKLKIIRIRSKEGTSCFEVDPNDDIITLAEKLAIQLKFDPSTLKIAKDSQNSTERNQALQQFSLVNSQPASTVGPFEPTTNTSSLSALNVKQEAVDDYLEKQSGGFIKRGRDPKFAKEFVEEPDYRVKQRCLNDHAHWPEGIKAVVEAIYEPSQETKRVGMIYTDLMDAGFKTLRNHLDATKCDAHLVNVLSDFHPLTYIKSTGIFDKKDFDTLARIAVTHFEADATCRPF
ncbi:6003_t:CDS:10, partial [Ambispora gerdemannii]